MLDSSFMFVTFVFMPLVCCGCGLPCQSSEGCGRMVPVITPESRVVSPVPLFSAAPTTVDDDAFLDCSHDDIILFSHQQFTVVLFSNNR